MLVIDDFLRAGGTLQGLAALLNEFQAEVVGTVVLVEAVHPVEKLARGYLSIVRLNEDHMGIIVTPGNI